jgi:hypothetical protein
MSKVCVLERLAHQNHTLVQVACVLAPALTCSQMCIASSALIGSMYGGKFSFDALGILIFDVSFSSLM